MRAALVLLCIAGTAFAGPADETLKKLRKEWSGLSRAGKMNGLMRLTGHPSRAVLAQCKRWLGDDDLVIRSQVVRLVAAHHREKALSSGARKLLADYVAQRLKERRKRQSNEFAAVCRKHGTKIPPANEIKAGASWEDPWLRPLPAASKEERAHMREVVGAIESTRDPGLYPTLAAIFRQHHDPDVLVRVIEAFGKLGEWRALPAMADLARIQRFGRAVGGSHVIGEKKWRTMRLKWDVHKDRLWWSRPEYVPRVTRPIMAAASTITGAKIGSVTQLDAWLMKNEAMLRKHGGELPPGFRKRAKVSQR